MYTLVDIPSETDSFITGMSAFDTLESAVV
jgi:hypothetical protein